mmetsp:Transcript_4471/g.6697  ORF Transcript_4471/g.6697 Transcript_4471/m.6697 type:complete len:292 (+) Transcript_4471:40-915(+)
MMLASIIIASFVSQVLSLSPTSISREAVLKPFTEGKAFKVISGLHNFDIDLVKNVAWAAENGGASHVDIACRPDLVRAAKSVCSLPICVSSITPSAFVEAVDAGADMVEIGNFDSFYKEGRQFSAADILAMTSEVRKLLPTIPLSVTIPHTMSLSEQIVLAKDLQKCGADIIQTEGKFSANVAGMGVQELIEIASPTLAAAYAISRAVTIPVMCASGLTDVTVPMALAAGARGVGVGSSIYKLAKAQQMRMAVEAISLCMGRSGLPEASCEPVEVQIGATSSVSQSAARVM